ncbi:hypothetical protein EIP86_006019 [Pleurotus ostreatoroseus]|nr:hypothetical protein EIP86_006019 [Pleurotus ostreatoroseus]
MDTPSTDPDIIFELANATIASTLGVAYIGIMLASMSHFFGSWNVNDNIYIGYIVVLVGF